MIKRLLFLFPLIVSAQVQTIPNTSFPTVRTLLNNNFSWLNTNKAASNATLTLNGVTITLGAANSITSSNITEGSNLYFTNLRVLSAMAGLYEAPLTFSATFLRTGNAVSLSACSEGEVYKYRTATGWTCESDQTGTPGSGISSLNGLTGTVQTLAKTDDANVTLTITSSGSSHTFALGWAGALAKARQHANTLYSDGAYSDPAAFTFTRTGGRLTGFGTAAGATLGTGAGQVPITGQYEVPLTFSSHFSRSGATVSLAVCSTPGQIYKSVGGAMVCADDVGAGATGTTSQTFQIDSGNSGPKWKNNAGVMEARNAADSDYADVMVKSISTPAGVTGEVIFTEGSAPSAPAAGKQTMYIESAGHTPRLKNSSNTVVEMLTSASASISFPTLNQNTTGTSAGLSGTPALPNGTTATTQSQADNTTKLATTAYVDTGLAGKQASDADLTAIAALSCVDGKVIKKVSGVWDCADDAAGGVGGSVNTVNTRTGDVVLNSGDIPETVNAQTGTTYTIVAGDAGKLVTTSNASAIAVTLPQAGGSFPAGWNVSIKNIGAGTVTVTPTTSTISGAASITLETGEWAKITSDGTNYEARGNRATAGTNVTLTKSRTGVQIASSGGGGGGCSSSATQLCVEDDFMFSAINGGAYSGIGSLNWTAEAYPTSAWVASKSLGGQLPTTTNHPGIISGDTSGTINTVKFLAMSGNVQIQPTANFDTTFIIATSDATSAVVADLTVRVGLSSVISTGGLDTIANGAYVEAVASGNFFLKVCTSSTCDQVDTGVANATSAWANINMKRVDSTTIGVTVNGGNLYCITSSGSAPAACTGTTTTSATHLPTAEQTVFAMIKNTAAANKRLTIDYIKLLITGLTR